MLLYDPLAPSPITTTKYVPDCTVVKLTAYPILPVGTVNVLLTCNIFTVVPDSKYPKQALQLLILDDPFVLTVTDIGLLEFSTMFIEVGDENRISSLLLCSFITKLSLIFIISYLIDLIDLIFTFLIEALQDLI